VPTATEINEALANGREVFIQTAYRCTKYTAKHAGMFFMSKSGNLHVKAGKKSEELSWGGNKYLHVRITIR